MTSRKGFKLMELSAIQEKRMIVGLQHAFSSKKGDSYSIFIGSAKTADLIELCGGVIQGEKKTWLFNVRGLSVTLLLVIAV